ncbi:phosphodiesterase [Oceaniglobus ichthyenteri]|uniref:phosphodiesterase n=1 Tax=Oceaniglobus ichthyenteri TaxID=2136177 RepID=UPI000D3B5280|nr:phosphodiesterase [Oceaniglobus ichthyenteri]
MVRILQISDPHIVTPPGIVSGCIDSAAHLKKIVARIIDDLPRIGPIDALLVTGDISDDGSPGSYALFHELIAPLNLPTWVIPGNHDLREPMRAAFSQLPKSGRLNWATKIGDLHLIGLDTLVEGAGGGTLDADTLDFLEKELEKAGQGPVLLALHHPPFASGIAFMDRIGLDGIAPLADILRRTQAHVRLVCGHIHSVMMGEVGGAVAMSCPATCSTFATDFRPDAPVGFFTEPGGYLVHDWLGTFRSIHIGPDRGSGPFSF